MFLGTFLAGKTAGSNSLRRLAGQLCGCWSFRNVGVFVFLILSCAVAGSFGQKLVFDATGVTALRLPTAISLAALVILGYRFWPAVFLGALLVNLTSTHLVATSFGIASVSTLEAFGGAYLVRRYAQGTKAFFRTEAVASFVLLAGILTTAISAAIGVGFLCQSGMCSWRDFLPAWLAWWGGDASASLVITPFLILLLGNQHHRLGGPELTELLVLLVGLTTASIFVFGPSALPSPTSSAAVLCIPFLLWAAFRFCPLEAAGANLVLCGFATWSSLTGNGPFASTKEISIILVLFVAVTTTMTLVVSAFQFQLRSREEALAIAVALYKSTKEEIAARLRDTADSLDAEVAKHLVTQRTLEQHHLRIYKTAHQSPQVIWVIDTANRQIRYVDPYFEGALSKSWERLCNSPRNHVGPLDVTICAGATCPPIPENLFSCRESSQEQFQVAGPRGTWRRGQRVTYRIPGKSEALKRFESISIEITETVKNGQKQEAGREKTLPPEKLHTHNSGLPLQAACADPGEESAIGHAKSDAFSPVEQG
jgi:integral membrane sensor domain MASE1